MGYKSFFGVFWVLLFMLFFLAACTTHRHTTRVNNASGSKTVYSDPQTGGPVAGIGIESQDIISMTDRMMRDMLSCPELTQRQNPPKVIVDSEYFYNEGSSRLNKNTITDRLRVQLNQAAMGRMVFVGRHFADMIEKERSLKRDGVVSTTKKVGQSANPSGGDYRLGGRITTEDQVDSTSGMTSRYHLITFEMLNLETGLIVWSGMYEFQKSAQDDVIYR